MPAEAVILAAIKQWILGFLDSIGVTALFKFIKNLLGVLPRYIKRLLLRKALVDYLKGKHETIPSHSAVVLLSFVQLDNSRIELEHNAGTDDLEKRGFIKFESRTALNSVGIYRMEIGLFRHLKKHFTEQQLIEIHDKAPQLSRSRDNYYF